MPLYGKFVLDLLWKVWCFNNDEWNFCHTRTVTLKFAASCRQQNSSKFVISWMVSFFSIWTYVVLIISSYYWTSHCCSKFHYFFNWNRNHKFLGSWNSSKCLNRGDSFHEVLKKMNLMLLQNVTAQQFTVKGSGGFLFKIQPSSTLLLETFICVC